MNTKQRLETYLKRSPSIPDSAYVAPQATVIGAVTVGEQVSIWPGCVLRGDINSIEIGDRSNVQDGTVIHLSDDYGVIVGTDVTIGHRVILHACTVEDECLIGMGAIIMDGAVVGAQSIVGARALITAGTRIPPGSVVTGSPARVTRSLGTEERKQIKEWAAKYVIVAGAHKHCLASE